MSRNVVDAAIEAVASTGHKLGFIPSRRQVEHSGGYVNHWTTNNFTAYVRGKSAGIIIERDHGGPMQGDAPDDGFESFSADSRSGFDIIHIDVWKQFQSINDAAIASAMAIRHCESINPDCLYEIGTEEAIRKYSHEELDEFLCLVQSHIGPLFDKVMYAVVQFGTSISGTKNTGTFDIERSNEMIKICQHHGLCSKEHNGDYLSLPDIEKRFKIGLDAINIAPEFGVYETDCFVEILENAGRQDLIDDLFSECLQSDRWRKWVPDSFLPQENKKDLIRICGHYVFSSSVVADIKCQLREIDAQIVSKLRKKFEELLCLTAR